MGGDRYLVTKQAATGFSGASDLKVEALREADRHCVAMGRKLDVISATENEPPYVFGRYPRAEVQFRCT